MKKLNPNPELPPKLKRFLAFAGEEYYPEGGWRDFKGDFNDFESAKSLLLEEKNDWAQIFDTEAQKIVWTETDS